ncbi:hypothetical protein OGAPHI_006258 [Ogataea philodendri]|uniref:Uncharacterized protein n=1 Tax=Ogataea philodendri TaxID=1378263 RepID=A0A9P8NYZ3_9ASCO|nr:uncharacterized protein OGAPHI_006258 [Ogataea philodendri]KAH3662077.1 hypothetical protein OGAPHI_006258 [Ogataea philodendri]
MEKNLKTLLIYQREKNYLWLTSSGETRIQGAFSNGEPVAQPREDSLGTQTVASVWTCSVDSLVGEPVVAGSINSFSLESIEQLLSILNSHGSSSDLTNSRHQNINRLGDSWVVNTFLHVERLDFHRESDKQDRKTNGVHHLSLGSLSNVVSELELLSVLVWNAVFVQPFKSLNVLHALERNLWCHKPRM